MYIVFDGFCLELCPSILPHLTPPPSPPELTKWFYLSLYNPITHIVHEQDTLRLTGVGIWLLTKSIKIAFVSFQTFILAMNNAPSRSNMCYNVC